MGVKRQKRGADRQLALFEGRDEADPGSEDSAAASRHGAGGEGGTEASACEASQASTALDSARALTACLMEAVCERGNLNRAFARVKANRGAAGVDGMSGKGWWRRSGAPSVQEALTTEWFDRLGLVNLERRYVAFHR